MSAESAALQLRRAAEEGGSPYTAEGTKLWFNSLAQLLDEQRAENERLREALAGAQESLARQARTAWAAHDIVRDALAAAKEAT